MKILHMTDPEAASNTTTPLSWKADPQVFLANGASHIAEFIELIWINIIAELRTPAMP